jgi:hypothetical protein
MTNLNGENGRLCVICHNKITNRKSKKAKTCNQSCAGKLAWRTINGN